MFTSTLYLAHKQISEHVKFYTQREKVFLHQNINPRSVAMAIVWVLLDCSILYELICHRQKEEEADYTLLVKVLKNTIEDEFMDEVLSRFTYEVYYDYILNQIY